MTQEVEVAIIGGGQAGLATSWYLTQEGVDHVILEAGRVAETWRSRRWDSFCLVTPNWSIKLPGGAYSGPDPDGFMPSAGVIDHLETWAASFEAPVEEHAQVDSLEEADRGFLIRLGARTINARNVVVATGAYQRAHRPPGAESVPAQVHQLLSENYTNPAALPPGAVLVVGSGQTGCQLAEELHESGRKVFVACGRCPWAPRRIDGLDMVWWAASSGFFDRTPDTLPNPAARLIGNVVTTGHGGGHDLHLRTLDAMGVELLGHFAGAEGSEIHFADDLAASADFGDARLGDLWRYIENHCVRKRRPVPHFERPEPLRLKTRTSLDVDREGLGSVIWTSGYRPEYGWVRFPVFDQMGFPVQQDGRTEVPGLYFVGVQWMRKLKSTILYGVGEDAEMVARQLVGART